MNNDLISREALKKAIEQGEGFSWDSYGKDDLCVRKKYIDNAPTVELFCSYLSDGEVRQPCVEAPCKYERPKGEWIPCSERLPDDMKKVLVWYEYYRYGDFNCMYQTYGFCYVCDGKWSSFINGETGWTDARIIAWQPLPKPYDSEVHDD